METAETVSGMYDMPAERKSITLRNKLMELERELTWLNSRPDRWMRQHEKRVDRVNSQQIAASVAYLNHLARGTGCFLSPARGHAMRAVDVERYAVGMCVDSLNPAVEAMPRYSAWPRRVHESK